MILISTGLLRDAAEQADHAGRGELPGRLQVEWLFLRQFTVDRIMAQLGKLNPRGRATYARSMGIANSKHSRLL
jgi:hypothetical protein